MLQRWRTSGDELRQCVAKLHRHQQTLARTLLHGDTHLGNIYLLPDGRAGLLDWQLVVRGHHMHDVNYIVTTALSIGDRRNHERDLLAYYLDCLKAHGVAGAPDLDRKSVVEGKRVSVRVDLGGHRIIKKKRITNTES